MTTGDVTGRGWVSKGERERERGSLGDTSRGGSDVTGNQEGDASKRGRGHLGMPEKFASVSLGLFFFTFFSPIHHN